VHALHQSDAEGPPAGRPEGRNDSDRRKAPIVQGALLSWVIVPFMELKPLTRN